MADLRLPTCATFGTRCHTQCWEITLGLSDVTPPQEDQHPQVDAPDVHAHALFYNQKFSSHLCMMLYWSTGR
jgi:hypothetical protein